MMFGMPRGRPCEQEADALSMDNELTTRGVRVQELCELDNGLFLVFFPIRMLNVNTATTNKIERCFPGWFGCYVHIVMLTSRFSTYLFGSC